MNEPEAPESSLMVNVNVWYCGFEKDFTAEHRSDCGRIEMVTVCPAGTVPDGKLAVAHVSAKGLGAALKLVAIHPTGTLLPVLSRVRCIVSSELDVVQSCCGKLAGLTVNFTTGTAVGFGVGLGVGFDVGFGVGAVVGIAVAVEATGMAVGASVGVAADAVPAPGCILTPQVCAIAIMLAA